MGGKTAIALGLVAGVTVGGLIVGGMLTVGPGLDPPPTAAPSAPPPSPSTVPSTVPSVPPSESPSRTPATPSPSGPGPVTDSPSPAASTLGEAFAMPVHFRVDADGIVRDWRSAGSART